MPNMIYLDYAAATPVDNQVLAAMRPYWQEQFFNPSATYLSGRAVAKDVTEARAKVARLLGARPAEIVFTAGGTESDNLAIKGVMERYPEAQLLVGATEHAAVIEAAQKYAGAAIPVDKNGVVKLDSLKKMITDKTVLISVMYANNETGTIQPIRQISLFIKEILNNRQKTGNKLPLYLHSDASQAANYLDLHTSRLGVDLMTVNGGKIYGPKQTGILFVKAGIRLYPQVFGGGQERGLRSGTENVPGIIGFTKALEVAQAERELESKRLQALRENFEDQIQKLAPELLINGGKGRLPNNIHVTIPGTDNERLMMQLDEAGVVCAVGSACSASHDEPSHVLKAMGVSDVDAQSSLRFTLGRQTTQKDLQTVVLTLQKILA